MSLDTLYTATQTQIEIDSFLLIRLTARTEKRSRHVYALWFMLKQLHV